MKEETINILLVDDDAGYANVIRHLLKPFQDKRFEISWISDTSKVIAQLKSSSRVDLVLMDYFLQNGNGLECIKKIFEEKIEIPIILLTSNKDFRIAIEAMKYGVEDYLIKEEAVDTMLPRTIINVLERVQLNKKLLNIEKEKLITQKKMEAVQELVVTMCHEFNNPLAAIKISTDILNRQSITPEQKEILANLNANITHLEKQIVKLRDINTEKQY
jgi:DNA-binding NtrC family response regulator